MAPSVATAAPAASEKPPPGTWLQRFPNSAFGLPLGLAANANMFKALHAAPWADVEEAGNQIMWGLSIFVLFTLVLPLYVAKCIIHPRLVLFEISHPQRGHLAFMVPILICLLALSAPEEIEYDDTDDANAMRRTFWVIAFLMHMVLFSRVMNNWMFSPQASLSNAGPPFFLTPIGWLLLCSLAQKSGIHLSPDATPAGWGIQLPAFCFGIGVYTFGIAAVSVLQNLPNTNSRGSPALFLLVAPPALAASSLAVFTGGFGTASAACLGCGVFLEVVILRLSHNVFKKPKVIGTLAGYTLAPAAIAGTAVSYATAEDSDAAKTLAVVLVIIATCLLAGAWANATMHHLRVLQGKETWIDPLAAGFLKHQAAAAAAAAAADAGEAPAAL